MRLRDHCVKIGSGATPRGGKESYLDAGPFSLIRSQNVRNDRFALDGLAFISEEQARALDNVDVQAGDVLVNITGDSVARVCQVDPKILPARVNQHVAIVRPNGRTLDAGFLRYWFVARDTQNRLLALASAGATRPALTKGMLENLIVSAPDIDSQRAIAAVLSALDDKIELNRRMNETLQASARALFRDWFVDFGPTRAKAEGRPAYLAPDFWSLFPDRLRADGVPEGWPLGAVRDHLELKYGKSLPARDRIAGAFPVYGSGGQSGAHCEAIVQGPTVIVGRKGTVGSLFWEDRDCYPIDTAFYVAPKLSLAFCYELLAAFPLQDMNTDAAVPGLNRENVYRLELPNPPAELIVAFDRLAREIRRRVSSNDAESHTLAETRDALLTKLMSGAIRVRDAERAAQQIS